MEEIREDTKYLCVCICSVALMMMMMMIMMMMMGEREAQTSKVCSFSAIVAVAW